MSSLIAWILRAIPFGTIIMYGALGETITEKSGNLNLGVPGIMYLGGFAGFASAYYYENTVAEPVAILSILLALVSALAASALGGLISADYCRFAKNRGDVVKSSIVGVIPAGLFMLLTGALMSIVTGQYDISAILASLGVPLFGLIALVLATWTTNVTNAYSGGLALSNLLGFDESKFKLTTGIAGGIGTLLAAFGLLSKFEAFLSLMSALLPPLAGVIIASYWIIGKGHKERFVLRDGVYGPGLVAYLVGAFVACLTGGTFASFPALAWLNVPFFVGPVNGIVVSLVLYTLFVKLKK